MLSSVSGRRGDKPQPRLGTPLEEWTRSPRQGSTAPSACLVRPIAQLELTVAPTTWGTLIVWIESPQLSSQLMFAVRPIIVCRSWRTFWDVGGSAACRESDHVHAEREMHVHRDEVVLPNGTTVVAATFDERNPYDRDVRPDFGLYLDDRWQPPWVFARLDWPDFGVPKDAAAMIDGLRDVLARAKAGERVEIGCWGAHGRTGTALAALAVLTGIPREEAVAWVRATYCAKAVETAEQETLIATLDTSGA